MEFDTSFEQFAYPPWNEHGPWKWWFPIGISFSKGLFSGAMLVLGRVIVVMVYRFTELGKLAWGPVV